MARTIIGLKIEALDVPCWFLLMMQPVPFKNYYSVMMRDRKSTRLNSSHQIISYAVFCLKKKKNIPSITWSISLGSESRGCVALDAVLTDILLLPARNQLSRLLSVFGAFMHTSLLLADL